MSIKWFFLAEKYRVQPRASTKRHFHVCLVSVTFSCQHITLTDIRVVTWKEATVMTSVSFWNVKRSSTRGAQSGYIKKAVCSEKRHWLQHFFSRQLPVPSHHWNQLEGAVASHKTKRSIYIHSGKLMQAVQWYLCNQVFATDLLWILDRVKILSTSVFYCCFILFVLYHYFFFPKSTWAKWKEVADLSFCHHENCR